MLINKNLIFQISFHFCIFLMKFLFFSTYQYLKIRKNEEESVVRVDWFNPRFLQLHCLTIAAGVLCWDQGTILSGQRPIKKQIYDFNPYFFSRKWVKKLYVKRNIRIWKMPIGENIGNFRTEICLELSWNAFLSLFLIFKARIFHFWSFRENDFYENLWSFLNSFNWTRLCT